MVAQNAQVTKQMRFNFINEVKIMNKLRYLLIY